MSVLISGPPTGIRGSKIDLALLRRRATAVLRSIGQSRSELSIALVSDPDITALNAQWRKRPQPTDVLSFSLVEGDFANHRAGLLGDVVISVETAAAQAAERHRALDEVVVRLLIHGVLHLIGHDHEEDGEARRMRAEERRLWQTLNP
jgi:probable rRNA maturation factor